VLLTAGITSLPQLGFPNDAPLCMCYPSLSPLPDLYVTTDAGSAAITVLRESGFTYCTCAVRCARRRMLIMRAARSELLTSERRPCN